MRVCVGRNGSRRSSPNCCIGQNGLGALRPSPVRIEAVLLGKRYGEHACFEVRFHRGIVEGVAKPQTQAVVALRAFEMKRLPIHADHMRFARGDDQVGSTNFEGNAGGIDTGNVNDEFHGIKLFPAVIARLAIFRIEIPSGAAARPGSGSWDDGVHEKNRMT